MTRADDPFDLARFVHAQEGVVDTALSELASGEKRSHWMWFIFPQIHGLGESPMARHYAISGIDEARAYLAHPLLGARLYQCTEVVNGVQGRTAREIFGHPDDLKFRSSMTLFEIAAGAGARGPFIIALDRYHGGARDQATLERL